MPIRPEMRIKRVRLIDMVKTDAIPRDGSLWLLDIRTFDIPNTIEACIRNAALGLVAITLSRRGGRQMIDAAERAACARGARILWWDGPDVRGDAEQLEAAILAELGMER